MDQLKQAMIDAGLIPEPEPKKTLEEELKELDEKHPPQDAGPIWRSLFRERR